MNLESGMMYSFACNESIWGLGKNLIAWNQLKVRFKSRNKY